MQQMLQAYRRALWALEVCHLLALRLCQVDALRMVPAIAVCTSARSCHRLELLRCILRAFTPGEGAHADSMSGKAGAHHSSHLEHMIMNASGLYGSSHTQYLHKRISLSSGAHADFKHLNAWSDQGCLEQSICTKDGEAYTGTRSGLNSSVAGCTTQMDESTMTRTPICARCCNAHMYTMLSAQSQINK